MNSRWTGYLSGAFLVSILTITGRTFSRSDHDGSGLGAQAYGKMADELLTRHAAVGPLLATH